MFGTALAGRRAPQGVIEFAEPLEEPGDKARILDKMWLWVIIAVVLILAAYGIPIIEHLGMERFGARGVQMF